MTSLPGCVPACLCVQQRLCAAKELCEKERQRQQDRAAGGGVDDPRRGAAASSGAAAGTKAGSGAAVLPYGNDDWMDYDEAPAGVYSAVAMTTTATPRHTARWCRCSAAVR
jgi:hypothetical protein